MFQSIRATRARESERTMSLIMGQLGKLREVMVRGRIDLTVYLTSDTTLLAYAPSPVDPDSVYLRTDANYRIVTKGGLTHVRPADERAAMPGVRATGKSAVAVWHNEGIISTGDNESIRMPATPTGALYVCPGITLDTSEVNGDVTLAWGVADSITHTW